MADENEHDVEPSEAVKTYLRRYREARRAGLTIVEARLFAESDADVGELRKLVKGGCPVELIRDIVL